MPRIALNDVLEVLGGNVELAVLEQQPPQQQPRLHVLWFAVEGLLTGLNGRQIILGVGLASALVVVELAGTGVVGAGSHKP